MNALFVLGTLGRAALWGAVIIGAAWLLCFAGRNHLGAPIRSWIWRLALLKMVLGLAPLSPIALSLLPPVERAPQPRNAPVAAPLPPISPNFPLKQPAENFKTAPEVSEAPIEAMAPNSVPNQLPEAQFEAPRPIPPPFRPNWPLVALGFWASGALFQAIQLARGYAVARSLRRAATPLQNEPAASILAEVCARLGVRGVPQLAISTAGPLLLGARNPLILLPEPTWRTWNEAELRLVLAHEVAHHKRADLGWNFLLGAAEILFWFHPLMVLARREWRANSEQACDELTLRSTTAPVALYGSLLLRLATQNARSGPAMVGVSEDFALLQGRLMKLKNLSSSRKWPRLVVALAVFAGAASLLPWQLTARAQNEVPAVSKTAAKSGTRTVSGRVVGPDGAPVAGATVYLMRSFRNGDRPTATMLTDAQGRFSLRDPRSVTAVDLKLNFQWGQLFVDGGARGMAFKDVTSVGSARVEVQLMPTSTPRLKLVDEGGRPVGNVGVRLWKIGVSSSYWNSLPAEFLKKFERQTDARGEVSFPPLPQGRIAQFMLADEREVPGKFMGGDHRGTRFAPLSTEDFLPLNAEIARKTIRLLPLANLGGVVKVGDSGVPVGNVQVVARRINAAEARGDNQNRDMLMASTRSNARGEYRLDGLRPGNYYLWLYPEKRLTRDYASSGFQRPLVGGQNRVDFPLSGGAIIEGRVVSAVTGKPVKGQTLGLIAPGTNYQYEISRADGTFRFRAAPGKHHFWVHANGTNSPPPGYVLPSQKEWDFSLENGQTKTFLVRLAGASVQKPITGRVVGPDGAPVAGAEVESNALGNDGFGRFNLKVKTDSEGRFVIPARKAARPLRLLAASGELLTSRGVVALAGDDVILKLEADIGVTFAGRVEDFDSKKPLAGAKVTLLQRQSTTWFPLATVLSQSDGTFKFSNQRPREAYLMSALLPSYSLRMSSYAFLGGRASDQRVRLMLRRATSFIGGRVVRSSGRPAVGFHVNASGADASSLTNAAGRFYLPRTFSGPITISVSPTKYAPSKRNETWSQKVAAGRRDVVFRLDKAQRSVIDQMPAMNQMAPKIGQIAPEIRAGRWFNSAPLSLSSLRGQVVLLDFNAAALNFGVGAQPEIEEVERAFRGRGLRVIGVQNDIVFDNRTNSAATIELQRSAAGTAFPVAVDASALTPAPARGTRYLIGATARAYGLKSRVVIDRAGRIAYAGDSLSDAVSVAAGLLAVK